MALILVLEKSHYEVENSLKFLSYLSWVPYNPSNWSGIYACGQQLIFLIAFKSQIATQK